MSENSQSKPPAEKRPALFRWQALLDQTTEPLFLVSRQRRLLFVNRRFEEVTGLAADQVLGLVCSRRQLAEPGPWASLGRALCPPLEVLKGQTGHVRRLVVADAATTTASRQWWDLDFFPLLGEKGVQCVLGKISGIKIEDATAPVSLPEKLVALREQAARRYNLEQLGEHPVMQRVADQVRLAANTRACVLIVGEPGTGKEWLARAIHQQGPEHEKTFVALDCRGLAAPVLEAALFGPRSVLRQVHAGAIYLKEPACLPREVQARLCDFLLASEGSAPRWITGFSPDPAVEVKEGRLLAELHCMLSTLVISLPPLRDRADDLSRFLDQFLARAGEASGKQIKGLTPAAWEAVRGYSWPGNLGELYAALLGGAARTDSEYLDVSHLPGNVRLAARMDAGPQEEKPRSLPLDELLEKAERRHIAQALREARGNKTKAAEILAIWRPRLLRRMEALGIKDLEREKTDEDEEAE